MKTIFSYILFFWIFFNLILFTISFFKVRDKGEKIGWIWWWASIWGAFVWEDLLVFSLYNIFAANIVLVFNDFRYAIVFILVFWIVRSLGEALYNFLQQFNQPAMYPHDQALWDNIIIFKKIFGKISDQKVFFLIQITMQVTAVFSVVFLIYIFMNWDLIGNLVNL